MSTSAIEMRGVAYRAGRDFELRDLSLNVREGAIHGFLGPNGAGKTTTIKLLLGLLRPTAGQVSVLGRRVPQDLPAILAATGYVPERPHLYPFLTVEAAVAFHAAFFPSFDHRYADELLRSFGLPRSRRLATLSKGEMGKLHILLVLAQRARLLILDEPTDGLDPVVRRDVLSALLEYCSTEAATVFISSHLVHELERICDWVTVMDRGQLVAEMPMQAFKNGIKRLRVAAPPAETKDAPFVLLGRAAEAEDEIWVVRGWQPAMTGWFGSAGATVRDVVDLDLEEGFVEVLNAARVPARREA